MSVSTMNAQCARSGIPAITSAATNRKGRPGLQLLRLRDLQRGRGACDDRAHLTLDEIKPGRLRPETNPGGSALAQLDDDLAGELRIPLIGRMPLLERIGQRDDIPSRIVVQQLIDLGSNIYFRRVPQAAHG